MPLEKRGHADNAMQMHILHTMTLASPKKLPEKVQLRKKKRKLKSQATTNGVQYMQMRR
ncbi:hypothetical protein FACS1894102_3480 [Spirochaetia bacterium]|nr:hypothetical protein FACS1894102_3480 [Spirochaetia bacterium]